jgi:hypothetical protein
VILRQESRRIIENTGQVLDDTGEIKLATTQLHMDTLKSQAALKDILEEVEEIKVLISQQDVGDRNGRQEIMRRYLDSLTEYGESERGGESPNSSASTPENLTPRLNNLALDPVNDSVDLQVDAIDDRIRQKSQSPNEEPRSSISETPTSKPPISELSSKKYPDVQNSLMVISYN